MKLQIALFSAVGIAMTSPALVANPVTFCNSTLETPFFPGSGNSNENFVITRFTEPGGNEIEVGLKSKERFFGIANVGINENVYTVQPGFSPESASDPTPSPNAWWNFDFSVDLGNRTLADTQVTLEIDFDGDGIGPVIANLADFFDDSISLIQDSQNIAFLGLGFNPNAPGIYSFTLKVSEPGAPFPLAGVVMQTVVVPLPTAAGMAFAGIGLLGARRRR